MAKSRKCRIDPSRLTPTRFHTAEDKAKFAEALLDFIESGFSKSKWTKPLYQRLSNCFSHIAHYDMGGFWDTWFSTPQQRNQWIAYIMRGPHLGDPAFTFSDVEREIVSYLDQRSELLAAIAQSAIDAEREIDERDYQRLKAKLGH